MLGNRSIHNHSKRSTATEKYVVVGHVGSTFVSEEDVRDGQGAKAFCARKELVLERQHVPNDRDSPPAPDAAPRRIRAANSDP